MTTRKSLFVIVGLLLTLASLSGIYRDEMNPPAPSKVADGGAPLPPIPKGTGNFYVV